MFRTSRRFWPLGLALGCWLLVFLVPATRSGVHRAWSNRFGATREDAVTPAPERGHSDDDELLRRFPGDKRVEIYAAAKAQNASKLVARYPRDMTVIALALRQQLQALNTGRQAGPLTNPNYPAPPTIDHSKVSPRADWNQFLALAARAQGLEPNNSYFSWMRLYGLLATSQDDAARAELARASRRTAYDDHARELALNYLAVMRLAHGSPLSPRDREGVWDALSFSELGRFRQTCRWTMETVIADRHAGRHDRALTSAFDLVRLGRVMRRDSYTIINSLVGSACEAIAMGSLTTPPKTRGISKPRPGPSLGGFHADARMLYSYAKAHNRPEITGYLDREWVDIGNWQPALRRVSMNSNFFSPPTSQTLILIATERFAVLCLRVLPSILGFGLLFAFLCHRFPDQSGARGLFWHGVWLGSALLGMAVVCDAIIAARANDPMMGQDFETNYFGAIGLLAWLPSWVYGGMAGATLCFALNRAVAWQKRQQGVQKTWIGRIKTLFDSPEDDFSRFDFGWVLGLAARLTGWLLVGAGTLLFCYNLSDIRAETQGVADIGLPTLCGALLISALLSVAAWHKMPRRRQTARVVWRFATGALSGFFVALSVIYTLVAFAVLPMARQNDQGFETKMRRGELAMARAQMGM